jgi:hypothetical protein
VRLFRDPLHLADDRRCDDRASLAFLFELTFEPHQGLIHEAEFSKGRCTAAGWRG